MLADAYTTDTTYQLQLQYDDGTYEFVDQSEYTDRADCIEQVQRMYGGEFYQRRAYRIIRHDRTPEPVA